VSPSDPLPPEGGARLSPVVRWRGGQRTALDDWLVEEVPVALEFNGISHAVMLASPLDLEEFALGFGLSEGLLSQPAELYGVDVVLGADGIELRLEVAAACEARLKGRRRSLSGRTGCGLCGTESLVQVARALPAVDSRLRLQPAAVATALRTLKGGQTLQQATGATHAAAWCDTAGQALIVREDVGRHNALDKLIGAMVRQHVAPADGFVTVTSRASFEMVQKTVMAGAGALVAVSAPTALAVRMARQAGLALAGFARGDEFVCYAFPERFGVLAL
jgi:FdhD protein